MSLYFEIDKNQKIVDFFDNDKKIIGLSYADAYDFADTLLKKISALKDEGDDKE